MLETLLIGACWSQKRLLVTSGLEGTCPLCDAPNPDDLRNFWTCPELVRTNEVEVTGAQYLVKDAVAGAEEFPCLWLRGCCPNGFVAITSEFPAELPL